QCEIAKLLLSDTTSCRLHHRIVERANAPVIYLSQAAESETGLLQSLVVVDGKVHSACKTSTSQLSGKVGLVDAMLDRQYVQCQVFSLEHQCLHVNSIDYFGQDIEFLP
ncbi:hypothetical protein HID58_095774, partial [Brassica napus]